MSTPDYIFPSTAALLQARLGITNGGAAFDLQAVATGFAYALATAEKFIRSGSHKRALVVGAGSLLAHPRLERSWHLRAVRRWRRRGGARKPATGRVSRHGAARGRQSQPHSVCARSDQSWARWSATLLRMDGQAVFKFAVKVLVDVGNRGDGEAGIGIDGVDWLISSGQHPHHPGHRQASRRAGREGDRHGGPAWQHFGSLGFRWRSTGRP